DRRFGARLSRPSRALLPPPRHRSRARVNRQRQVLQAPLGRRVRTASDPREEDTALPPTDQWKGRALHPHAARALGLRRPVHARTRTGRSPTRSTRLIQSPPTTPRPRGADTVPARQQPLWDEHLAQTLDVVVGTDFLDLPVTGQRVLGVVVVNLEQLDEERTVMAYRVPKVLRRSLAALTRAGD